MTFYDDAAAFLRSIDNTYEVVDAESDATIAAERLQGLEARSDSASIAGYAERERWLLHALERLIEGAIQYRNSSYGLELTELLEEMAQETADLGAWGAITHAVLDTGDDLEPEVRRLIADAITDAVRAGAHAWARLYQANTLLGTSDEGRGRS